MILDFNTRNKAERILGLVDHALCEQERLSEKRNYLGASRLGVSCSRALQYELLSLPKDAGRTFSASLLRTFAMGHVFETMLVKWLRMAGFRIVMENKQGQQYGFAELDGKLQGHIDGVIVSAPPFLDLPLPLLLECKSLNNKSWRETKKYGVTASKPIYAGQISLYQAYMEPQFSGISKAPAVFVAINKDTSDLHFELLPFNGELAQRCSDKGVRVIDACENDEWLPRISRDPSYFECKLCDWRQRCWQDV